MKFVPKTRKVMGDYIALHHHDVHGDSAKKFEDKIPKGEVWVREDWWRDPEKRRRLKIHEGIEINLIEKKGLSYAEAHNIANKFEKHRFR